MKCQKCGRNEVSFHYTTNVNGCVTETHLCSQCAAESGYDIGQMFDMGNFFDGMFPMHGEIGGFMPMAIPVMRTNAMLPFTMQRRTGMIEQGNPCDCGCGKGATRENNVEVDEVMSKRRELNIQMRAAVEKEEFEKAAELRDKIKELEAQGQAQGETKDEAKGEAKGEAQEGETEK